eukprot:TRINITY_DN476_c0_g1_i2.p2 TRINITY_DN476_c0_g1~~TRINITY_DN476_c0_g1_i2.p2  ORF type:complete len:103 (-),score=12.90 TRINITY_DN476_c0_g1_i2:305-613(-)
MFCEHKDNPVCSMPVVTRTARLLRALPSVETDSTSTSATIPFTSIISGNNVSVNPLLSIGECFDEDGMTAFNFGTRSQALVLDFLDPLKTLCTLLLVMGKPS